MSKLCEDFGWGERAKERDAQYDADCRAISDELTRPGRSSYTDAADDEAVRTINATLDAWSRDPLTAVCPEPSFLPCNEEDDLPWL